MLAKLQPNIKKLTLENQNYAEQLAQHRRQSASHLKEKSKMWEKSGDLQNDYEKQIAKLNAQLNEKE
jgi:predicted secreted protein